MTVILPLRYEPPSVPNGGRPCEALPGYYLLEVLGRTPLVETWKARDPNGRLVCVKYVYVSDSHKLAANRILDRARRLVDMRHAHLATLLTLAYDSGRLILVTELPDQTLQDRFEDCWRRGSLFGIPREELVEQLLGAAEALDYLRAQHNIQHLGLSPRTLVLCDDRLMVSEFGLAQMVWLPAGEDLARINPRYAAPEVFEGRISANSDQYSLALIYQEMLTGQLPQKANSNRDLADLRLQGVAEVSPLPAHDREIVRRALHRESRERFPSCVEFISALLYASATRGGPVYPSQNGSSTAIVSLQTSAKRLTGATLNVIVEQLVSSASTVAGIGEFGRIRWVWTQEGFWQHRCAAFLPAGVGREKLRAFAQRWNAECCELSDLFLRFELHLAAGFLKKLWRRPQDVLEVSVEISPPRPPPARLSDVLISMRFLEGNSDGQRQMIEQIGPVIAEELHAHLMAPPDRREELRFPFDRPLLVAPIAAEGSVGGLQLQCVGKDISHKGIGIFAPMEPPSRQILIYQTSTLDQALFAIPAIVTRVELNADGWYEIGAEFLLNSDSPSSSE